MYFGFSSPAIAQNYAWAKAFGSVDGDAARAVALDASGNVYTVGYFLGTVDFDPGIGTEYLTSKGEEDIFISKLDASGNYVWAKSMGGVLDDLALGIALDALGNVYTVGRFEGTVDFDPGTGIANLTSAGMQDIFICKLDASGNYVWAKSIGGIENDLCSKVTIDAAGNIYTLGNFSTTVDFDPGTGTANLTSTGLNDIFISKLDASGNFVWARGMGGTSNDYGLGIAIDASNNVYTTGTFTGSGDFDPNTATSNLTSVGAEDIFISKLDASGNYVWAKSIGGTLIDAPNDIALNASGDIYCTGRFQGTVDFDPSTGTANLTSAGTHDIFISKLDASGNYLWAKRMGGTAFDVALGMALDATGNVYTTGSFTGSVDFDPGAGTASLTSAGLTDIFISKLDASGNYVWAKNMGGTMSDISYDVSLDASGNIYSAGYFAGTSDFDPNTGNANLTSTGDADIFISKLSIWPLYMEEDKYKENDIKVFPNPSNKIFTITGLSKIANEQFTLRNNIGQNVSVHIEENGQLDMSAFPAGVYYLKINRTGTVIKLVTE